MLLPLRNAGSDFVAPFLQTRKKDIARLALIGMAQAGGNIVVVLMVKSIVHHALGRHASGFSFQQITGIVATLTLFILARAYFDYRKKLQSERLGQEFAHATRIGILNRIKLVSGRELQKQGRGVMILRLSNDLTALRQWVTYGVAHLVVASVSIIGSLIALSFLSAALALPAAVALSAGIGLSLWLGRPLGESLADARKRRGQLSNSMSESVSNMVTVQAHGHMTREIEKLAMQSLRVVQSMVLRARYSAALRAISEGTTAFASLGVLLVGAYLSSKGHLATSTVLAALSVVGLLSSPVRDFERTYEYWYGAEVAAGKLRKLLQLPTLPYEIRSKPAAISGVAITIEKLNIAGTKGFSAEANPGDRIVISGPPGSGKSTLCLAIAGLVAPDSGAVSIGGVNVGEIERDDLRKLVSIVSPEVPLFRGTIRKNLLYRNPDAEPAAVDRACDAAGLETILARLPDGLDTRLADGGVNLSTSERQHVSLARAIIDEPAIVVVDAPQILGNDDLKCSLLELMNSYPGTVIIATEDAELAAQATAIWFLRESRNASVADPPAPSIVVNAA